MREREREKERQRERNSLDLQRQNENHNLFSWWIKEYAFAYIFWKLFLLTTFFLPTHLYDVFISIIKKKKKKVCLDA